MVKLALTAVVHVVTKMRRQCQVYRKTLLLVLVLGGEGKAGAALLVLGDVGKAGAALQVALKALLLSGQQTGPR